MKLDKRETLINCLVILHGESENKDFKQELEKLAVETLFSNEYMIDMRVERLRDTYIKFSQNKELAEERIGVILSSLGLDNSWKEKED